MINHKEITILIKNLELKLHCKDQIYVISMMHIFVVKGIITVNKNTFTADDFEAPNNTAANATATNKANNNALGKKIWFVKITHHLLIASQKLMV